MTAPKSRRNGKRDYRRHGLTTAKQALQAWGERSIDGRTRQGKALAAWKAALVEDLGGFDAISAQRLTILDMAARTKILLDGIDAWMFEQPCLVNKRARKLFAVVQQRQQLADSLAKYMGMLGLDKHRAESIPLADYVTETYGESEGE